MPNHPVMGDESCDHSHPASCVHGGRGRMNILDALAPNRNAPDYGSTFICLAVVTVHHPSRSWYEKSPPIVIDGAGSGFVGMTWCLGSRSVRHGATNNTSLLGCLRLLRHGGTYFQPSPRGWIDRELLRIILCYAYCCVSCVCVCVCVLFFGIPYRKARTSRSEKRCLAADRSKNNFDL